jgi:hypothetical protein
MIKEGNKIEEMAKNIEESIINITEKTMNP